MYLFGSGRGSQMYPSGHAMGGKNDAFTLQTCAWPWYGVLARGLATAAGNALVRVPLLAMAPPALGACVR